MSLLLLLPSKLETVHTSQVPEGSFTDGTGLTLGTAFRTDTPGQIVGVRMYRAATAPSGAVIGGLFSLESEAAGTELARATFGALTPGWNAVFFASPVSIAANTVYVAAYWTPDHYVADWDFFVAPVVNGHVEGVQQGQPVVNGRFNVGPDLAFPQGNGNFASYFADPLFQAGVAGPVTVTLGQAVESDTAGGLGRLKAATLGHAAEVDTAGGLGRSHLSTLGRASEADTTGALTRRKVRTFGQAAEVDTAGGLARSWRTALGQSVEVDTAGSLSTGSPLVVALGRAVEADTAGTLTRRHVRLLGQAAEADTGRPLTVRKAITLGQAASVEAAGSLQRSRVLMFGRAGETSSAFALARVRRRDLGRAVEVDTARSLTVPHVLLPATALAAVSTGGPTFTGSTTSASYTAGSARPGYAATTRAP